jgi:hypothetical protein
MLIYLVILILVKVLKDPYLVVILSKYHAFAQNTLIFCFFEICVLFKAFLHLRAQNQPYYFTRFDGKVLAGDYFIARSTTGG